MCSWICVSVESESAPKQYQLSSLDQHWAVLLTSILALKRTKIRFVVVFLLFLVCAWGLAAFAAFARPHQLSAQRNSIILIQYYNQLIVAVRGIDQVSSKNEDKRQRAAKKNTNIKTTVAHQSSAQQQNWSNQLNWKLIAINLNGSNWKMKQKTEISHDI